MLATATTQLIDDESGTFGKIRGRARPGWELLYNHYAKVKGMNAPYSQAFAEKERPEGYGERGTAEAGDLGFGTLLYTEE